MHRRDLLKKLLDGQLTQEEFDLLIEEMNRADTPEAYEQTLQQLWQNSAQSSELSPAESDRMLGNFKQRLKADAPQKKQFILPRIWYRAAAITGILLIGMAVWWLIGKEQQIEYATGYGETQTIILPDSTSVILNGNSRLSFDEHWSSEKPREVWLDGEAYFSVVHTQNNQRFRVNVTDELQIEVLGTEFNVNDRREKAQVVLSRGKVRLDVRDTNQPQTLTMQPGELVEFSETDKTLSKKQVNPEQYIAWRHHTMVFEETTLRDIADDLEDNYGVTITIEDSTLATTKLTGAFPTHNLEMILTSLPTIIDMDIQTDDKQIIFSSK
uniref:FecR domain-containing protein n=1 Tax=Roseihalotalea indica TaxID=2867963 RepID=A0AA49GNZ3_9BACT|nr:FecR domain-containing protein [Tunicatimonas sp. TK19036]